MATGTDVDKQNVDNQNADTVDDRLQEKWTATADSVDADTLTPHSHPLTLTPYRHTHVTPLLFS